MILPLAIVWVISIFGTWLLAKQSILNGEESYSYLNERLQYIDSESIEKRNAKFFSTLTPLKEELLNGLGEKKENVAFYVEDLNSGAWVGWKERDPFIPASLLKVPIAMGAMKKIDKGDWNLDTTFTLEKKYKDQHFGSLWTLPDNTQLKLSRILDEMLKNSDNTASRILIDKLSVDETEDVFFHIGMKKPENPASDNPDLPLYTSISAKDLAQIFRSLFNSTYLTRESSNYILKSLTETKFNDVKPITPSSLKIAHKIGTYFDDDPRAPKNYHDCGVTYFPQHPYLYCVMTKQYNEDEGRKAIVETSYQIYQYFDRNDKKE